MLLHYLIRFILILYSQFRLFSKSMNNVKVKLLVLKLIPLWILSLNFCVEKDIVDDKQSKKFKKFANFFCFHNIDRQSVIIQCYHCIGDNKFLLDICWLSIGYPTVNATYDGQYFVGYPIAIQWSPLDASNTVQQLSIG